MNEQILTKEDALSTRQLFLQAVCLVNPKSMGSLWRFIAVLFSITSNWMTL